MPRMGRVVLPEYPHHITQRGHDKNVVFAADKDYRYYLETLAAYKDVYGVSLFAYCRDQRGQAPLIFCITALKNKSVPFNQSEYVIELFCFVYCSSNINTLNNIS